MKRSNVGGLWMAWCCLTMSTNSTPTLALSSGRTKRPRQPFRWQPPQGVSTTPWWSVASVQSDKTRSSTSWRIIQHQQQIHQQHSAFLQLHSRASPDQDEEVIMTTTPPPADHVVVVADTATMEDGTYSPQYLDDNGLDFVIDDEDGRVTARPRIAEPPSLLFQELVGAGDDDDVEVEEDDDNDNDNLQEDDVLSSSSSSSSILMSSDRRAVNHPQLQEDTTASSSSTTLRPRRFKKAPIIKDHPATVVPSTGFNVVLTHATADFDSLASAVGLAKLWSTMTASDDHDDHHPIRLDGGGSSSSTTTTVTTSNNRDSLNPMSGLKDFDSSSHVPTFVVLPRGAHPGVQKFLALHKHLFPIRSLKSLPSDLAGLNRLGLVDAQRRDRLGPAEHLLAYAKRVTIVDHHIDSESDITEATDYVVDKVGSVSTLMVERLRDAKLDLTEAEATLLALGIHADTGSLCFDSTTPRDANALAWVMRQGASQTAIAEHARSSLSTEQQGVLTQALIYSNTTVIHGVTLATVLLTADGFINGLAAVTEDALEMSSSDVFLLALVYEAGPGGASRKKKRKKQGEMLQSRLFKDAASKMEEEVNGSNNSNGNTNNDQAYNDHVRYAEAWRGGDEALRRRRLRAAFDRKDTNGSGYLEKKEIAAALAVSGTIVSDECVLSVMEAIDTDGDGRIDFEEFVAFAKECEQEQAEQLLQANLNSNDTNSEDNDGNTNNPKASTMIIIGRVKAGVHMKAVKLNKLLEKFNGGGHPKAASATLRLNDVTEAEVVLQGLVDELIETNLQEQPTVGDFMTAPVLSIKPHMTEKQVEDLFTRYDVRALPVVDDNNDVIGLVTYKEVAAAKQRLWNKEQKRRQQREGGEALLEAATASAGASTATAAANSNKTIVAARKLGSTVKGWMKQHVQVVETSKTMAEVEAILLENDVGCIPVVADGTRQLVGMVTRTDLLRQHRYYPSLHYHNKGFSDSIAARKPIIELRKKLKKFDIENE